jgi:putative transposase
VTVCTKDRKKILADPAIHEWVRHAWQAKTWWSVGKYLIMPDHIHFFCAPTKADAPTLSSWIKFWKSFSARSWPHPDQSPIWQRDFWDTQLRRDESYETASSYVDLNPVRAGLVATPEAWPYRGELNQLHW